MPCGQQHTRIKQWEMRLSWNEVRARAAAFAEVWQDATYEKGETQSFYNAFFRVFGVQRRTVARYEAHIAKLGNRSGFIDLFWPGVLLVEQKGAGRDLGKACQQAGEYFDALRERERPRYILVSGFQSFQLHDLDEGTQWPSPWRTCQAMWRPSASSWGYCHSLPLLSKTGVTVVSAASELL